MKFSLFLFSFLLFSCQSYRTNSRLSNEIETVNFEKNYTKPVLNPSSSGEDVYGPKSDSATAISETSEVSKTPIITLNLTPALYQSLGYGKVFSNLEKNKLKPNIIITSGFSAIIAAIYGKYLSASRLDWKIYALGRALKDESKVFSSEWYEKIENFLDDEFGKMNLEELKIILALPVKKSNDQYELIHSGSIVKTIMESLKIQSNKVSLLTNPSNKYIGLEKKFGSDLTYNITMLPRKIYLKSGSGFVLGVYSKLAGYIHFKGDRYFVLQQNDNVSIDEFPNISDLMSSVSEQSDTIQKEILDSIDSWTNKNR